VTALDYQALARDYLTRQKDGFISHLRAHHEEDQREETFEIFENLPDIGPIAESQEYSYWFDAEDHLIVINDLIDEAVRELGVTGHWMCDDPGTLYLSEIRRDYDADSPAEHARIESEAHDIQEAAVGIYNAFRKQLTPAILEQAVDEAVRLQEQADAERRVQNAERRAREAEQKALQAHLPQINEDEVERILGINHRGLMQDKLRTLSGTAEGPDVLYVSPYNLAGGTVHHLAEGMRALLRAGNYAVAPIPGRYLGQAEQLYVKYVPGKPPRAEHQLASAENIVAVIEQRMSEQEWLNYLGTLGL
jgi:hypothetical protein